jgi:acyl carrier protein
MDGALGFETEVAAKIRAIIAKQAMLEPEDVAVDDTLASLGLDSLGLVETLFSLEETFEISIPFNANDPASNPFDISTVGALIRGVEGLIGQR